MLENYEKFNIIDTSNRPTGVTIEVNWKPKDPDTNECKILKMTLSDGQVFYVKKELLNALLFTIGSSTEQSKMIPQKIISSKWYETVISVKAKRDILKGESITFPLKITLPDERREAIQELKKKIGNGHSNILY